MEISAYVKKVLVEIINGVADAQEEIRKYPGGAVINPEDEDSCWVDFHIVMNSEAVISNDSQNRIHFVIPLSLPKERPQP